MSKNKRVYNLNENKFYFTTEDGMVERNDLVYLDNWMNFQEKYFLVITSLIDKSSVFVNLISDPQMAYNDYIDCFNSTASSLYIKMRETICDSAVNTSINKNWYFSLKTLTYHWLPIEFDYDYDVIEDTVIYDEFIPFLVWEGFVSKQIFGRLIPANLSKEETYQRARDLFLPRIIEE